MATITTDTFLDGGTARTAGEAWTCNGGKLTVRTDTRWHANAPASMTGSLGSIGVSATLGGGVLFDARNVRWLPYNTGSGNVPAIGTTVTQGGVSGYLLGVWANLTSAPTAVGAAMPATGFIKFREVTGGPFAAGALTGISASATGADTSGWIEVVMDQAAAITVNRKGSGSVTRGDWFYLDDTTGSVGQVLQTPTNGGGAGTYAPGVWIENSPGSDEYSFWAGLNGATNGWAAQHIGQPTDSTDSRTEFVKSIGSGQMQIGEAFETASLAYTITNVTTATYTWAANVVTVSSTAHGLVAGEQVYLDFTSGGATANDGIYTIFEVTSANAFKVALTGSGASGNVTFRARATITYASQPFAVGNKFYVNVTSGSLVSGVYEAVATAAGTITINAPAPSTTGGNLTLRLTIGKIPPSGCKTRIPNVILRQCATGTRATNAAPNATLATRPDFVTTGAGVVDHEYTYGDWYYLTLQSYQTRLVNVATFDAISIAECASRFELINGGCGMHGALDVRTLDLISNFAGGQITDWHSERGNAPGTSDHATALYLCKDIDFLRGRSGIIQFARSTGFAVSASQTSGGSYVEHSCINSTLSLSNCSDLLVENFDYSDRYIGSTNTGALSAITMASKCSQVVVDGMTLGLFGEVDRVHPYTALVSIAASEQITIKNIGSISSPVTSTSNGTNCIGSIWVSVGNNQSINVKRCYIGRSRIGPSVTVNTDKDVLEESCYSQQINSGLVSTITPSALNHRLKGIGAGQNSVAANAAVYGTHIYDIFTSDTTGRVVCVMNEPTVETASQVTYVAGDPQFTSVPSVSMPTIGDEVIIEMNYFAKGHTGLENTAPTITGTNTGNFTLTYQIDLGAGYNGSWLTLNGANLSGHSISPSTGFKMKFRVVTATAATTNALTHIRINTTSTLSAQTDNLYPIQTVTATLELTGLKPNTEVRVYGVDTGGNVPLTVGSGSAYGADVTASINYPAGIQADDVGLLSALYNPSIAVPDTPSGWTVEATNVITAGSAEVRLYKKTMAGTESGALSLSWAATQKVAWIMWVGRNVDMPSGYGWNPQSSSTLTDLAVPAASVGSTDHRWVTLFFERTSSGQSTSLSGPGTVTASVFGTGGGATSSGIIPVMSPADSDGSVGAGTWTRNGSGTAQLATMTIALPANIPAGDLTEIAGIENSGTSFSYVYEHSGTDTDIEIVAHALGYLPIRYDGLTLTAEGLSIPVQQTVDRQYQNI